MADDAASKFINALIKSVQTLCHGYLDFENGVEIIGHINLSVDRGNSLDYILKEKVCKNAENSTLFISNSFHAEPKPEQDNSGKSGATSNQTVQNSEASDTGQSGKVSSAISSISSALAGSQDRSRRNSGGKDSDLSHSYSRTGKRKASEDQSSEFRPAKVSSHHDSSQLSFESPSHPNLSSPVDSKLGLQDLHTDSGQSETMLPQTAGVSDSGDIGVNLAGSVLEPVENQSHGDLPERDDDSDGDLEVTFIKEEYVEGERSACEYDDSGQQFSGGQHQRASEGMADPSLYPVALHSSASSTYVPGQHYPSGSLPSQPQAGPSGTRGLWGPYPPLSGGAASQVSANSSLWTPSANSQDTHRPPYSTGSTEGTHRQPYSTGSTEGSIRPPFTTTSPYHSAKRLNSSMSRAAQDKGDQFLQCQYCDSTFVSESGLRQHVNSTHLKKFPFTCSICHKGFTHRERCADHMGMHNKIKRHQCPRCARWFTFKTNLPSHMVSVCYNKSNLT